ncbi:MAG TPA: ribonuclease III domain-containing protein, partial [Kofleriaceae bacterium]|nr:ribonuclease III domain-containing protein [Kofleriaceae bacterium]
MTEPSDYGKLEAVLGYTFRERGLLEQALRHASWCNEHAADHLEDNERLEFLGDAVLDLVVGHKLMTRYPQLREGELSVTRAQVVSEAGLGEVAGQLGIGAWLLLGKGEEKSGGRSKPSILADAFEAILAAV